MVKVVEGILISGKIQLALKCCDLAQTALRVNCNNVWETGVVMYVYLNKRKK